MKFYRAQTNRPEVAARALEDFKRRPDFYRDTFHVADEEHMRQLLEAIHTGGVVLIDETETYVVDVRPAEMLSSGWPALLHLSIKRRDREPIHDWRILQQIKNAVVGPEHEGVELYPAESRLVDTANQYHLFVLADPAARFPFGFTGRVVTEESFGDSRQRPFGQE